MDLWIRSQDKLRLMKVDSLFISYDVYKYTICGYYNRTTQSGAFALGAYKTKERALEVLDEIQATIRSKFVIGLDYRVAFSTGITPKKTQELLEQITVYEMPKE